MAPLNDSTDPVPAERFPAEINAILNRLAEAANEGIWMLDAEGRITYLNRQMAEMLGYSVEELLNHSAFDFIPVEDLAEARRRFERRKSGNKERSEFRLIRKDGSTLYVISGSTPLRDSEGETTGVLAMITDVTDRKQAERELRESEERYRQMFEKNRAIKLLIDPASGQILDANPAACRYYGYSREDFRTKKISEINLLSEEQVAEEMRRAASEKRAYFVFQHQLASGDVREVEVYSSPVNSQDQTILYSIVHDITDRKRAEEGLRQSQREYESLVNSIEGIVWKADAIPLKFTFVSRHAERLLGYAVERWLSEPTFWEEHIHRDDRQRAVKLCADAILEKKSHQFEYRMIAADGHVVWLRDIVAVLEEEDQDLKLTGVMVDITELKNLEEHLRQSQKLEAVGKLAGGIAHDFNNLLTAILGQTELMLRRLEQDSPLRQKIEEIRKAGARAASLTHQLLAFSRKQILQPKLLNLNEIVLDMDKMLQRLIGEDIELVIALNYQAGLVEVDPGQISQVIMNLAINARDAMPRGGKLTIETTNVYLDEEYAGRHVSVRPGFYTMLAVSDTGVGMDSDIQKHIFEPFFTTKEVGRGTGLGLSTVYGIIKQSGGNIWVYSEVGVGTTFKIYLPQARSEAQSVLSGEAPSVLPQGTETVLLVEDEKTVRTITREILEMCGYRVIEAASGAEAISICERQDGRIDLLFTDVVMPRMSGRELAKALTATRPQMRVLYMSGYTDDAIVHHGVLDAGTAFIQKPFTPDDLARKVREVLDAPQKM